MATAEQVTCPVLKQRLISAQLERVLPKLVENQIATIDAFTNLNETELNTLCDKLELNEQDAVKLKQLHQKQVDSNKLLPPIKNKAHNNNANEIDDMQHILEQYFTEIEGGCDNAKKKIDEKFQEIIKLLTTKQKQLHQQIDEWKLNQLENINKEISNITQYKDECKSDKKENDDNDKYKTYKDSSELIKHIQSITPLISIDINTENDINIKNGISSLTEIKYKNYVSFPTISLIKPQQFIDKNNGYSVKLKFSFKDYDENINKDNIIFKYKRKNDNDDDDEKWNLFKHGSITMIKGENESKMETQLLNVLKLNESYLCQIEYLLKKPIDIVIKSNIEQFINIKKELNDKLSKIKLEYYCHRKHSLTRHPKYLLLNSDTKQYWSSFNNDFERNETDWIIFKYKDNEKNKKWIPKQIIFKNYKSNQDISRMNVYIGNNKTKEWFPLTKNPIQPKLSKDLQYFEIDNFDEKMALDSKYTFIKLEFIENYGETNPDMCRFCCRHFALMGIN